VFSFTALTVSAVTQDAAGLSLKLNSMDKQILSSQQHLATLSTRRGCPFRCTASSLLLRKKARFDPQEFHFRSGPAIAAHHESCSVKT